MESADRTVAFTIAAFANYCTNKRKIPYFRGKNSYLFHFFREMKKEHPKEFEYMFFDDRYEYSEQLEKDMFNLCYRKLVYPQGINYDPYEADKEMLRMYNKCIPDDKKKIFDKMGKKLYHKIGCDRNGRLGEHTSTIKKDYK